MTSEEEPLLSELCRICNARTPIYRCPRCFTRTCSLQCSKRHKPWFQCSGVRDPAAYVKRSELATPAGIDRDFNFIVGIERNLERGEKKLEEAGVDIPVADDHPGLNRHIRPPLQKGEFNLHQAFETCQVIVEKAPKGFQRSKDNLTHWHKKQKCIQWTVEWIHDGDQRTLGLALEHVPLDTAYSNLKRDGKPPSSKKRKLEHISEPPARDIQAEGAETTSNLPIELDHERQIQPKTTPSELHFYLLRPRTCGASRVLIPLSSSDTLSTCLKGQVVLEFPTVYVLPEAPPDIPEGFLLESQYLEQAKSSKLDGILSRVLSSESQDRVSGENHDEDSKGTMTINEGFILDVLKKDLGTIGDVSVAGQL